MVSIKTRKFERASKILTTRFVFWLAARKLLEMLEQIIAFEAGCVNQKSYLEILE